MKEILEDRKKLTFIIVIFCIVLALIIFGIFMLDRNSSSKKEAKEKSEYDTKLEQMGISENEYKHMTDDEKNKKIQEEYADRTSPDYSYKKGKKEYPDTDAGMELALGYLGGYKFDKLEEYLSDLKSTYNFTTKKNRELMQIYNDAQTLTTIKATESGYKNALNNLQHPASLIAIYLGAPATVVKYVTIDQSGKYPLYKGTITLKNQTVTTEDVKNDTRISEDVNIHEAHYSKVTVYGKTAQDIDIEVECYTRRDSDNINVAPDIIGCYEKDGEDKALFVSELVE